MPNNKEHSDHTSQKLGVEAADLHHWMDQPARARGRASELASSSIVHIQVFLFAFMAPCHGLTSDK